MVIEPGLSQRQRWWPRVVVATVLVLAPIGMAVITLFGGGQVRQCLGLGGCPGLPAPETLPIIGTTDRLVAVLLVLAGGWLTSATVTIRYLWSTDRSRLVRVLAVGSGLVVATAAVVAVLRLADGQRLRIVAEDAGLWALGAAILVAPLVLAWAILTVRRPAHEPASRQTSTPS